MWTSFRAGGAVLLAAAFLPRPAGGAEASRWELRLGLSAGYDSNVIELSDHDRGQVGNPRYASKYTITSPDDYVWEPEIALSWSRNLLRRRTTTLTAFYEPEYFTMNSLLNEATFGIDVEQEIGKDRRPTMHRVEGRWSRTPHTTLRHLKDDDESLFAGRTIRYDSVYSSEEVRLRGTAELVKKRLALDLGLDREWRNYIYHFDERDGTLDGWEAGLEGHVGKQSRWRLQGMYREERYDGRGDFPGTPWTEDDISSDRVITSADVRFRWGKKDRAQRLTLEWELESRDYTAESPWDFYHTGRRDRRTTWTASWRRELPDDLAVWVEAWDERNRTSFATPPPTPIPPDETTSYDRWTLASGVVWKLDLRKRRHEK